MERRHLPARAHRAHRRPSHRDRLSRTEHGHRPPTRGRIPPDRIFPAGVPALEARMVALPGGVRLRVVSSGDPSAPTVLLVHGWGGSAYMWRGWFAPLVAAGFRALAVDLPGHGLSDKPTDPGRYTLDSMISALRALVDVEGLAGAHVVAQSMGGTIALEAALRGEGAGGRLVLVNPAAFGRVRLIPLARRASPRAMEAVLERVVPRWIVARAHRMVYGNPALVTEEDIDQYWAPSQFPGHASAMRRLVHEFTWRRLASSEMAARLRSLPGPASPPLVVLGTGDRLVRESRPYVAALRAAGAPLELYESVGGGHAVNEERPEEVVPVVVRFLTE